MSVIALDDTLDVSKMSWSQYRNDLEFRSSFGAQAVEIAPPLWTVSVEAPSMAEADSGAWKSFLVRTRGKTTQVSIYDKSRPQPLGTYRGTLTLQADATQGATTISLTGGSSGQTLLAGDWLGIGSLSAQQLIMVSENATADVSGNITITFEAALRNAFSAGASVVWDKPTALFRRKDNNAGWDYADSITSGFSMQFIEDYRP
jgi:hypothetical protein